MRLAKEKTYQGQTFSLHISLDIDDEDLGTLKLKHLS
jgi:hypothetical protein